MEDSWFFCFGLIVGILVTLLPVCFFDFEIISKKEITPELQISVKNGRPDTTWVYKLED